MQDLRGPLLSTKHAHLVSVHTPCLTQALGLEEPPRKGKGKRRELWEAKVDQCWQELEVRILMGL